MDVVGLRGSPKGPSRTALRTCGETPSDGSCAGVHQASEMLSPDQYEIMVARTSYGVRQAMLFELLAFSKSVLDQFWLWRTQRGLRSIAKYLPPKASYKG